MWFYLDDLLLRARSRKEVALQTLHLVSHLSKPGFFHTLEEDLSSSLSDNHLSESGIKLSQHESAALAVLAAESGETQLSSGVSHPAAW